MAYVSRDRFSFSSVPASAKVEVVASVNGSSLINGIVSRCDMDL